MFDDFPDDRNYKVVINHEEQYSIWPAGREAPRGWKDIPMPEVTGFVKAGQPMGTKAECLRYIEEVWTDMRPLSLHKEMADQLKLDR